MLQDVRIDIEGKYFDLLNQNHTHTAYTYFSKDLSLMKKKNDMSKINQHE